MSLHPSLHKAMLAGLARAPLEAELGADPALSALLKHGQPTLLWQALAANDLWHRAGHQPQPVADIPQANSAPAPADVRSCPRGAERVLQTILRGIHADQLASWLQQAQAAHMRLPHASLVALLEMGMAPHQSHLRPAISALLDQRGAWLVRQHPLWSERYGTTAAAGADIDQQWQLGNPAERGAALLALRRRDPGTALALLEADWANEAPEQRALFVRCLAAKLSLADEPFLERALDDKRKDVRSAAQELLGGLPGSQMSLRCITHLSRLLKIERQSGLAAQLGGLLSRIGAAASALPPGISLHVALPEMRDAGMKRDGIGAQAHRALGERASWLLDLVRRVPPQHWSAAWQLSPPQIIALITTQDFQGSLLSGMAHATAAALRLNADAATLAWFDALIVNDNTSAGEWDTPAAALRAVMAVLPAAAREQIVLGWLERPDGDAVALRHVLEWTRHQDAPLSPALSRRLLHKLQRLMPDDSGRQVGTRSYLTALAECLDVTDISYLEQHWPDAHWEHWPSWRKAVDTFLDTARFRHAMQRGFMENPA